MRILHTSDWHLGHTLQGMEREYEHRAFLKWLIQQICFREIDVLLIAGDIFDTANPGAKAQELWYWFLAEALRAKPGLQIVGIAGNHDSAARLEAPDHLLRQFDIRMVGSLPRHADDAFDPAGVLVPLKDAEGKDRAIVIAMPFLRPGDLPEVEGEDPLIEGVRELYTRALEAAGPAKLPILAMGHCYLVAGKLSAISERKVLGGNQHALPTALFPEALAYVALGHLHLPQAMDGERIRYSGSPIPLSIAERDYPHSVTVLGIQPDGAVQQEQIRIPRVVDLIRIPDEGALPVAELLVKLGELATVPREEDTGKPMPFLELMVQLERPDGTLQAQLEAALEGKGYFLTGYKTQYPGAGQALGDEILTGRGLSDMTVEDVFRLRYASIFKSEPSPEHLAALHEIVDQVNQESVR